MNTKNKEQSDQNEEIIVSNGLAAKHDFLIVGIGASAGGVEALTTFFENVPQNSGVAYVVILHLSPHHTSNLAQIIQGVNSMPVIQVQEKVHVEPNHIYVVSPNQHLEMMDGHINVSLNTLIEERRAPIDIFFRTLAESHGQKAVGVILSGTGADGSMGIKRVKERGGAAFVQNPREALYNDMPRNSIATDLIDEVLPVAEIPAKIVSYKENLGKNEIAIAPEDRPEEQQHALREIFLLLRVRTGHDFTNYKRPTLLRRIERRIHIRNLPDLSAYAAYVRENPEETVALLKDLLISVTNFFRDKTAFEFLEKEVLPKIIAEKEPADALRIWVVGCATGEEAYSLAMLCAECTIGVTDAPKIQIFATDIDETALANAREGLYTINDAADVSPERLRRFFTKEGDEYRVRRELREMILFASHNIIKDPPFSRIDLISCRNMLIYLNQTAQEQVMAIFHFALNPAGFLFIGNSESADTTNDLYATLSREHHVYQSRTAAIRSYPIPERIPLFTIEHPQAFEKGLGDNKPAAERISYGILHQQMLEKYAPPSVIVNQDYDILHLSETAGRYLQIGGGEPSRNLIKLVKRELRLELRTTLHQAVQRQTNVEASGLKISIDNKEEIINILVRPVLRESNDTTRGFILVLFEPATKAAANEEKMLTTSEPILQQLEEELTYVKSQLRTTSEQFEVQTEEMKASNEELQALNEELRSAAEELETSKEELQSINEELTTVNQELKIKIEETSLVSNNLQNFINSTEIGTIFLDRSLRVNLFTPAARQIFNLIPSDYGRPLTDITSNLKNTNILEDAEAVLQSLRATEKEVQTANKLVYLMRITPYRTNDDRINGVVISFVDITERKETEEWLHQAEKNYSLQLEREVEERTTELKKSRDFSQATMDSSIDMIQVFETVRNKEGEIVDFKWVLNNHTTEKIYGNVIGKSLLQNNPGVAEEGIFDTFKKVVETGISNQNEIYYVHEQFNGWFYQSVVKMGDGLATITTDITERKKAEQEINRLKDEIVQKATDKYLTLFNSIDEAVVWCEMIEEKNGKALDCRMLELNPAFEKMTGITAEGARGKTAGETIPGIVDWMIETYTKVASEEEPVRFEKYVDQLNRWFDCYASPVGNKTDKRFVIVFQDITERKKSEKALQQNEERYRIALEAGELATWDWNMETNRIIWNEQHFRLFGLTPVDKLMEPEDFLSHVYEHDIFFVQGQLINAAEKTGIYNAEFRIVREDNQQVRWMYGYGRVTERKNDKATRMTGVMYDNTDRKKAEDELKSAQNSLTTALDAAKMGVWDIDFITGKSNRSSRHDQLLGFTTWQEHWSMEKSKTHIAEEDKIKFDEAHNAMLQTEILSVEVRINHLNGITCWVHLYGRLFKDAKNEPMYAAGVIFDITDRKTVEKQKDEFIGIASHELKTPVTSIKAYAEILHEMFTDAQDFASAKLMSKLDAQVDRLTKLIRDLLDVTKVSEGLLLLTMENVNLSELINNTIEEIQRTARGHAIKLTIDPLPEVWGDKERLGQVLTNLLSNAIKYSPNTDDILVNAWYEDEKVKVSVRDSGIGMSPATVEKLFTRFFRSDNPSIQSYPGLGLGLFISMEIMKRHSGTILVKSETAKGSVFTMILPPKLEQQ